MRVVAYYRVSSLQQRDRDTIAGQRSEVRALVASRGWQLVAEHEDDGRSARKRLDQRTGFASVLAAVRSGAVDAVVCVAFDRLTRAEDLGEQGAILGALQAAGVRLVTGGGEETDLGTFGGRVSALVRGQLAAQESIDKAGRTHRGRVQAARAGKNPGRQPFGYRYLDGQWSAPGAPIILEVYERACTESCESISGDLNRRGILTGWGRRWTGGAVRDMIRPRYPNGDPYVTGLWIGQRGEPAIPVPAIVPRDLAERARAALAARASSPPASTRHVNYLDARAARCALCGGWVRVVQSRGRKGERFAYYGCERRIRWIATGGEACTLPLRRVERVDAAVWRAVMAWSESGAVIEGASRASAAGREQAEQDLAGARRQIEADAARLEALADALGSGAISAESYRTQVARVAGRRDLLARQVATWEGAARVPDAPTAAARAEMRMAIHAAALTADAAERRDLVRRLFPQWIADTAGMSAIRSGGGIVSPNALPERIAVAC